MPALFADLVLLFAQNPAPAAQGGEMSPFSSMLLYLPIVVLLWIFIVQRPRQAEEKKRREMLNAVKRNDRVLTQAGIFGTVVSVAPDGDRVVLRVDDDRGVKLEFSRASIVRVLEPATDKEKEKPKAAEEV